MERWVGAVPPLLLSSVSLPMVGQHYWPAWVDLLTRAPSFPIALTCTLPVLLRLLFHDRQEKCEAPSPTGLLAVAFCILSYFLVQFQAM